MNACQTHVIARPIVLTPKAPLFVNVTPGILEMASIVLVSMFSAGIWKTFHKSYTLSYLFLNFVDIDECLSNPCHANASCNDTNGSFTCQCNVGYSGNGLNCSSKNILYWFMQNIIVFVLITYLFYFFRHWRMLVKPMSWQCQLYWHHRFLCLSMQCRVFRERL